MTNKSANKDVKKNAPEQKQHSSVIKRRMVLLYSLLILVISAIFTAVGLLNISRITERNLRSIAELTMQSVNREVRNSLLPALDLSRLTAAAMAGLEAPQPRKPILANLLASVPAASELYYATAASRFSGGSFTAATSWDPYSDDPQWDHTSRPWYSLGMQNPGKTVLTAPFMDAQNGKAGVSVVTATAVNGTVTGLVGAGVFVDDLSTIVSKQKITSDGSTFIITRDGAYVAHENRELVLQRNFFESPEGSALRNAITGFTALLVGLEGNAYWASTPVAETDWYMVTIGSTNELTHDFRRMLRMTIILAAGLLLASIVITLRFSDILTRPIISIAHALKDISEGEGDLTRQINIKAKDETGDMAHYYNRTIETIKNLIVKIKRETTSLSGIGDKLMVDMEKTADVVGQISVTIWDIQGQTESQSEDATKTDAAMHLISRNVHELDARVDSQLDCVARSSAAIEQMLANIQSVTQTLVQNTQNVDNLSGASEVGRAGLQEVAEDIKEIARESEGLLEINTVMENIASQTNLLSMNAAIEAAHAGEAGKGFAVVADEIRKLAENSSGQSKTINAVLKKIKTAIDKITVSTDNVLNKFEAIDRGVRTVAEQEEHIRNAMEEQGQGSKQILEAVGELNENARQVKSRSQEMLESSEGVIQGSQSLEATARKTAQAMAEMAEGTNEITEVMSHLDDVCGSNRAAIGVVLQEVSRFKVE